MISRLFQRPWIFVTIVVLLAAIVMIRLGFWQLDRLEQRQAFNAQVLSQIDEPTLPVTSQVISSDIESLEFRMVQVQGDFDFENTLVLGNQVWQDQIGVHLLTPLKISDTESYILVDRGWIPFDEWEARNISAYDLSGAVSIEGMLRQTQTQLGLRDCVDGSVGDPPFQVWCLALETISDSLPYELLPVYLIQAPGLNQSGAPYQSIPQINITEGPHLSYAIQWFTFSAILIIGYPFFVNREMQAREKKAKLEERMGDDEYHGWAGFIEEDEK
jgi:surfeit locus 1 family protein